MKTKSFLLAIFVLFFSNVVLGQVKYESSIGLTLTFNNTWKRVPKEKINLLNQINDYRIYKSETSPFEVCYQKIDKPDMSYPYVFVKTYYGSPDYEDYKNAFLSYFLEETDIKRTLVQINSKSEVKNDPYKIQLDNKNKIMLIFEPNNNSTKSLISICFREDRVLATFFSSNSSSFDSQYWEFLDIIYSIEDSGFGNMTSYTDSHNIAVNYYNDARIQSQAGNKDEAIKLYTKAIDAYPPEDSYQKAEAYYNRGVIKRRNNNFEGAIFDYTEAINLRFDYYKAYLNRGSAKLLITDISGAIEDFTQVIKYDNYNSNYTTMAFGNLGIAKFSLNIDGCPDLKKAIDLGSENQNVYELYNQFCK